MKTTRKPQTKQAEQRPAWGNWRKPTPRELENFKIWWKEKYGYEPRSQLIKVKANHNQFTEGDTIYLSVSVKDLWHI